MKIDATMRTEPASIGQLASRLAYRHTGPQVQRSGRCVARYGEPESHRQDRADTRCVDGARFADM